MTNETGKHRPKKRHHGEGTQPFRRHDHRRNKPFAAVLSLGSDPSGRRIRKWYYAESKAEAERLRDEARRLLSERLSPAALDLTTGQYLERWLLGQRDAVRPSSWDRYRAHVEVRLIPGIGQVLLWRLTPDDVRRAKAHWTVTPRTIEATLLVLRKALRAAVADRLITWNPAEAVEMPKVEDVERRALSVEEARKLLDVMKDDSLATLVTVTMAVGLRRGEALGLRWSNFDESAGLLRLTHQLRRMPPSFRLEGESPYRLVPLKTRKSKRPIVLPEFALDALVVHRAAQEVTRKAAKVWAANDLVFADSLGNMLPPGSVSRHVQVVLKRGGLGHLRFHELRHSAASILLALGVDIRVVQLILGHRDLAETETYTHVEEGSELMREAAGKMHRAMQSR